MNIKLKQVFEETYDRLDWYLYLIKTRWHIYILNHYVVQCPCCDSPDCDQNIVYCANCNYKELGWLSK